MGVEWGSPDRKRGPGVSPPEKFEKFALKFLPSGAMSAKKLASVSVQNNTAKRQNCCSTTE